MTAVDQCIEQYGRKWKGGIVIVVWTDESGDDILYLEDRSSQMCKRRNVVVSVVGPTAVLGSEQGRHHYVDKPTGYRLLAADQARARHVAARAVAAALLARFAAGPWIAKGRMPADGTPWYGGPHREGLLSGVGPYALDAAGAGNRRHVHAAGSQGRPRAVPVGRDEALPAGLRFGQRIHRHGELEAAAQGGVRPR